MEPEVAIDTKTKEYEEYVTITEEIFRELMQVSSDELGKIKPIKHAENQPETYPVDAIQRAFERTKEYHAQLEKHIKKLYDTHKKQMNKKLIDKDT